MNKANEAAEAKRQREAHQEQERQEEQNRLNKFVGTYRFVYASNKDDLFHAPIMVVKEDGRAVVISETVSGDKVTEYVGNVIPRSETAFSLSRGRSELPLPSLTIWREGRNIGATGSSRLWTDYFVFDLSNGYMYRTIEGYNNRDISTPEYIKFSHSSTTSY